MTSTISSYAEDRRYSELLSEKQSWLVTGAAGFIGSHLCECLLSWGQKVVAVDNYSTGLKSNVEFLQSFKGSGVFEFHEGDVCDESFLSAHLSPGIRVLHQAALGSVPRSFEEPVQSFRSNVLGSLALFESARKAGAASVVYASSSSVYGDSETLPKVEGDEGQLLSPYALSKWVDEEIADLYKRHYGYPIIGLRYFNVFGPRQNPEGAYAAVIPKWVGKLLGGESCELYGDGETSRDFTFVRNVVDANLLASLKSSSDAQGKAYNIASRGRVSLNELYDAIVESLTELGLDKAGFKMERGDFRQGDIRHSFANVDAAGAAFGYEPRVGFREGLLETLRVMKG